MKQRPILFSTPMVQAILNDRKTITRRTSGLELINECPDDWEDIFLSKDSQWFAECGSWEGSHLQPITCPYGKPGDILWVRETWMPFDTMEVDSEDHEIEESSFQVEFGYKAGGRTWATVPEDYYDRMGELIDDMEQEGEKWKPSIHMPRAACRLFLEITDVRAERLQEISEDDAIKEGIMMLEFGYRDYLYNYNREDSGPKEVLPKKSFQSLWCKINGPESWELNPWVWVVSFKRSQLND